METNTQAADRLGSEGVGKLLLKFSIPAIVGMLVNALYNVVDRVFVGRGVDEAALGGLSLILPLMTIFMAFAMLFGIGAANMISMCMGQGKREDAENALNHCFWLLIVTGLVITTVGLVFLEPILSILGAEENSVSLDYARDYFRIILFGSVFALVSFGFSHCTRAQGFPNITMIGMFIGAGLNMILDPIFIFSFGWGVEGAAWATIISQLASCVWILSFNFSKKAIIRLEFKTFKPSLSIVIRIISFGSAQFLLQFIMSGVQLLYNASMGWYGSAALGVTNGGDVALSGMNINGSLMMMILMPVFGINQGAQPVLGYNYGAKKFRRVLHAYLLATIGATAICLLGFIIAECFPRQLVSLFAPSGSPALITFSVRAMQVSLLLLPLNGFQIVSSNFFVVTGRPKASIFLSMLRQFVALIPCIYIFGKVWGLWGVVAAAPVADGASFIITCVMILIEMRNLKRKSEELSP
ncbi:MAG: MATE family efflux transporter [Treponema sp.]|jgi:putative MATE family efflux protein|nr:MATE family efflux transporter [Treponema sp.]